MFVGISEQVNEILGHTTEGLCRAFKVIPDFNAAATSLELDILAGGEMGAERLYMV